MNMRSARKLVATVVAIILSTAVHAAEYLHLNAATNNRWRTDLLTWLQKNKPDPTSISIAMTPGGDVHAYVVPGQFGGVYTIERIRNHPVEHPNALIRAIIDGGTGRMIGFATSEQPVAGPNARATFDVFLLTWTKGT
jgi:hypothetical protein